MFGTIPPHRYEAPKGIIGQVGTSPETRVVGIYIRIAPIVTLMLIRYLDGDVLMSLVPVSTFRNHP